MLPIENIKETITSKSQGLHQSNLDADVHELNQAYWMYVQQQVKKDSPSEVTCMTAGVAKLLAEASPMAIKKLLSSAHLTFRTTLQDKSIVRIMDTPDECRHDEDLLCQVVTGQTSDNQATLTCLTDPLYVMNLAYWFLFKRYAQNSHQDASERFRLSLPVAEAIASSTDNQLRKLIARKATFKPLIKMPSITAILTSDDQNALPVISRRLFDFLGYKEVS